MPNSRTFKIPSIAVLLNQELSHSWKPKTIDPFPFPYKSDALKYLKKLKSKSIHKLVFDPPYSLRQLKEVYAGLGRAMSYHESQHYWSDLRNEITRITAKNAKVISFGWNTIGIGVTRGFTQTRILIVCHGGHHHDTLCTVEIKNKNISQIGTKKTHFILHPRHHG